MTNECKSFPGSRDLILHFTEHILTLLTSAEAYFYLGYSVIPLLGDLDPTRPKIPAVPWSRFQHAHASLYEHNQWFSESQFAGIGIVTGHISKLVVLDFDAEDVFKDFRTCYPDLIETHTVRSAGRALPHLYFKLPDHLHIESMKGQGIDVLSNGRYIVASPTSINGQEYKIVRGGMPKPLTERDIRRIQAFLATLRTDGSQTPREIPKNALKPVIKVREPSKVTPDTLARLYKYHCQQGGRNEALFRTSLFARNSGWDVEEAQQCLVELHSRQKGLSMHESYSQRQREAVATIRSAFSRPSHSMNLQSSSQGTGYLPNSVRETLLQSKMTYLVRTIEGLAASGIRPGQIFSTQIAEKTLKGLVGRDSIHRALKSTVRSDQVFFERVFPVIPFQTAKAVARQPSQLNNKECSLLPKKDQEKPQGGRPEHYYRMPSVKDLCRLLKVDLSASDPLERTDLGSAHQTRMAIHRELIKRRPGQYTRRWLANRLGVTKPTINRYNRLIPIHSRTVYTETIINWSNIERLPFDEPLQGAFLQTIQGKKYPALRVIASMLLTKGMLICLKEQGGNYYWYKDTEPLQKTLLNQPQSTTMSIAETKRPLVIPQEKIVTYIQPDDSKSNVLRIERILPRPNFRKPLRDASKEALAHRIYAIFNINQNKLLSLTNARRVVWTYPTENIQQALQHLQLRPSLHEPVGYFITVLRSNTKIS